MILKLTLLFTYAGLTDVLLLYPDFAEKFAKDIHNDLTYNLRHTGDEDSDEVSVHDTETISFFVSFRKS